MPFHPEGVVQSQRGGRRYSGAPLALTVTPWARGSRLAPPTYTLERGLEHSFRVREQNAFTPISRNRLMARILLGVTGSVAAIRTPRLFSELTSQGHEVKVVATNASLYFFDPQELDPTLTERNRDLVVLDADEWPGLGEGERYLRGDAVMHIELRRWAELFLIAPLDANTLAKLVNGICDNCLTCVWRAWDPKRPSVLAPAMNTLMWQHPLTRRQLRQLGVDAGAAHVPSHLDDLELIRAINERAGQFRIVPPQVKELACGDLGIGAMADVEVIAQEVEALLGARSS
jgi:phosphopantothenoylcysteine decarboxylase